MPNEVTSLKLDPCFWASYFAFQQATKDMGLSKILRRQGLCSELRSCDKIRRGQGYGETRPGRAAKPEQSPA